MKELHSPIDTWASITRYTNLCIKEGRLFGLFVHHVEILQNSTHATLADIDNLGNGLVHVSINPIVG